MKTSNQKLLELLNVSLQSNKSAMMRSGLGQSVSKLSMAVTQSELQNAIALLEEMINEA